VPFSAAEVVSVDESLKTVTTSNGKSMPYDFLLLNMGASTNPIIEGDNVSPVKPMSKLLDLRQKIVSGSVQNLLIIGGGAAGSELALNISHPQLINRPEITILDKNDRLLSSFPKRLSTQVSSTLKKRGVTILTSKETSPDLTKKFDESILANENRPESFSLDHNFKTEWI
jgi:NADH dehydrogenase FAD-containing subunit